jgi:hypothetical protein
MNESIYLPQVVSVFAFGTPDGDHDHAEDNGRVATHTPHAHGDTHTTHMHTFDRFTLKGRGAVSVLIR